MVPPTIQSGQPVHFTPKRKRMIVERLYQIQKAANEILELTNQDLVNKYDEPYHDCDGQCDTCFITGICSQIVDLASLDIDVMEAA